MPSFPIYNRGEIECECTFVDVEGRELIGTIDAPDGSEIVTSRGRVWLRVPHTNGMWKGATMMTARGALHDAQMLQRSGLAFRPVGETEVSG